MKVLGLFRTEKLYVCDNPKNSWTRTNYLYQLLQLYNHL